MIKENKDLTNYIDSIVTEVANQNDRHELLRFCLDFNSKLIHINKGGSFDVILHENKSGGYLLGMEHAGSGVCYDVSIESLNESLLFITNQFLCDESKEFTKNTSMRLIQPDKSYIDLQYTIAFESAYKRH